MNTTKVFANTSAAMSSGRLDAERLRRIVECKTVAEAFKVLGDYGYAYSEGQSVDGFIVGETNKLIQFVAENSASEKLANALLARFKYNNAKLAYKSRFTAVPDDGYYALDFDCKKIADGDYSDADPFMTKALEALDEAGENRPQAIDLALTRAMYEYILSCGVSLIKKYARAEIDMKNILTAARMKKLGIAGEQFISGGKVSVETLTEALAEDDFASCFEHTPYAEYAERIAENDFADLWKSELEADDYSYWLSYRQVASYASHTPFLNYYTETLIELKTVKTALVCVKTDSRDTFYKRMPEIYK
ncbi:MAG: V-type ATPase subunit [Clostridiales bacterium]|nr:V-type ATPase subunit [Clostridiales bacterium]